MYNLDIPLLIHDYPEILVVLSGDIGDIRRQSSTLSWEYAYPQIAEVENGS